LPGGPDAETVVLAAARQRGALPGRQPCHPVPAIKPYLRLLYRSKQRSTGIGGAKASSGHDADGRDVGAQTRNMQRGRRRCRDGTLGLQRRPSLPRRSLTLATSSSPCPLSVPSVWAGPSR